MFQSSRVLYHGYMNGRSYVIKGQQLISTMVCYCNKQNYNEYLCHSLRFVIIHRITSSARYAIIQLHIVILCAKWRNIRDSRTIYWIVHGTWTWRGCFSSYQSGKRCQKISRHSLSTNRAPQWNFYASLWKFYDFSEKHRKPLQRKGLSRVKQMNPLPFRCRIGSQPCKSTVQAW